MSFKINKLILLIFFCQATSIYSETGSDDLYYGDQAVIVRVKDYSSNLIDPYGNLCNPRVECADGRILIFVMAESARYKDPGQKAFRERDEYTATHQSLPVKRFYFETATDIKNVIADLYNNNCVLIKDFQIRSHGSPGSIEGKEGYSLDTSKVNDLNGTSCAFAKDTQIFISGCSVGKGLIGESFVAQLGKRFLYLRGGEIIASQTLNYAALGPAGIRRSVGKHQDSWRSWKFNPSGQLVKTFYPLESRITILKEHRDYLKILVKNYSRYPDFIRNPKRENQYKLSIMAMEKALETLERAKQLGGLSMMSGEEIYYLDWYIYVGLFEN